MFQQNLVDLTNLQAIVPQWNGTEYTGRIPDTVFRSVMWDSINRSFRLELIMADFVFYELKPAGFDAELEEGQDLDFDPQLDVLSREDREIKLQVWMSFQDDGDCGFGSKNLAIRQRAIYALFRVMLGWTRIVGLAREVK